jgi:hypothetical protein
MATTVQTVFNLTMAIADELDNSGLVSLNDTAEYRYRTPSILSMLEAELLKQGDVFKTYTVTTSEAPFSTAADGATFVRVTMPTDFYSLEQVSIEDSGGNYYNPTYQWEGSNTLLIGNGFTGSLIIVYRPVPTLLTAMTDNLTIDDITARTLLPYALGAELFKDENETMYNHCMSEYQRLKKEVIKKAVFTETVDCY